VAVVAIPAQAHSPKSHSPKSHSHKSPQSSNSHKCKPHSVGYNARGTLVGTAASLTQTKGADTPDNKGDDRWSGTLTVNVTKVNHHAATGSQSYTLDNDRVNFYDANHDGTADPPKDGDRVKVKGKITRLNRKCDQTGFTPQVTVRKVQFRPAEPAQNTQQGQQQGESTKA
jgi:hypothetical protein